MPIIQKKTEQYFLAANDFAWATPGVPPKAARLDPNVYTHTDTGIQIRVKKVNAAQNIQENLCNAATVICNVEAGMPLLISQNLMEPPIHIEFDGNGVSGLGSYVVARFTGAREAYTASLYVRLLGSAPDDWLPAGAQQGFTGDVWSSVNPSFAPFVGCNMSSPSHRIIAAKFDAGHSGGVGQNDVGLAGLWFYE